MDKPRRKERQKRAPLPLQARLGARIKFIRLARTKTSQHGFAYEAGVAKAAYSCVERGLRMATVPTLVRIADNANLTLTELIAGAERGTVPALVEIVRNLPPEKQREVVAFAKAKAAESTLTADEVHRAAQPKPERRGRP